MQLIAFGLLGLMLAAAAIGVFVAKRRKRRSRDAIHKIDLLSK